MNNLEQQEQEILKVENEYWLRMWEDLQALKENKAFQRLILEGYFKDKAVNGVSLLANEAIVASGKRSAIMEDLVAISKLQDFFMVIENLGNIPPEEEEEE